MRGITIHSEDSGEGGSSSEVSVQFLEGAVRRLASLGVLMAEGSGYRYLLSVLCLSQMDTCMRALSYSLQSTVGLWPVGLYPGSAVLWLVLRAHGLASRPHCTCVINKTGTGEAPTGERVRGQCRPLWKVQHLAQVTE